MKVINMLLLIIFLIACLFGYFYLQDREEEKSEVPVKFEVPVFTDPPKSPSKFEQIRDKELRAESLRVKKWLIENGYSFEKTDKFYKVKGPGIGSISISITGTPLSAVNDITITTDGRGNLKIIIRNVGTGIFIVDSLGDIKPI